MSTATTTKDQTVRELSLEELDAVAGGGEVCIGLKVKSLCLGIDIIWGAV